MTSLETLEGLWRSRPGGLAFAPLAERLYLDGRADQAVEVLAEGVRRWPRNISGRLLLGRISMETGDVESARLAFQAATELDGSCRAALEGLAESNGRGQYYRQALDAWARLSALEPDHPRARDAMRDAAQRLDAPGGLSASAMLREEEDARTREALSEGATTHVPVIAQSSQAMKLDLNETFAPPSGFPHLDAPTIPELPGFNAPDSPVPVSPSLLGKGAESSFATLEMPSFPARTIPPPPLELPKAPVAESVLAAVVPPSPVALPVPNLDLDAPSVPHFPEPANLEAEATQFVQSIPAPTASPAARVTGDDIEHRLDEVFGSTTSLDVPPPPPSATAPLSSLPIPPAPPVQTGRVTGADVEGRLKEIFGESSISPVGSVAPAPAPALAEPATAEVVPVVSGEDIEGRLDDLFGESVIDLTTPVSNSKSTETSAVPVEEILPAAVAARGTDTAAVGRDTAFEKRFSQPAESTAEMDTADLRPGATHYLEQAIKGSEIDTAGSTIDLPTVELPTAPPPAPAPQGQRLTAEDVDSRLDELFASSEFLAEPGFSRTESVTKTAAFPSAQVTGDDIEGRLDDLFGGDSDFPVGLPTVTFAEEYLRQGHKDKAASIYRQLLEKDPANAELRARLAEIEGQG